jgi:hypothetical protein
LLGDTYSEDELIRHLEGKYGPIADYYHLNYNTDSILGRLGFQKVVQSDGMTQLQMRDDFENVLDDLQD